jgi:hypothetical protein
MSKNSIVNKKTNKIQQTISKLVLTSFKTNTQTLFCLIFLNMTGLLDMRLRKNEKLKF